MNFNMATQIKFLLIPRGFRTPSSLKNTACLDIDRWDDYTFKTQFFLSFFDSKGTCHKIGSVKIGFKNQQENSSTYESMSDPFFELSDNYFSVGQDVDYYENIFKLDKEVQTAILTAIRDIPFSLPTLPLIEDEKVLNTSLLRSVSISAIKGQFARVLAGHPPLTDFRFKFLRPATARMSSTIDLEFRVKVESTPSTNIHAIIGRNGVGKTTLLNGMIDAVIKNDKTDAQFIDIDSWDGSPIKQDYFSSLVSVSFSAFDIFSPPKEQPDPALGTCYFYIGLKKDDNKLKSLSDIHQDFTSALGFCFSQEPKKKRWLKAINTLESDENFAQMNLKKLASNSENNFEAKALKKIQLMSSGHAVVLLTITRLVATVEEKTLVLIDEPESHLHPPLLSAFIRALSELLYDRNGVSIIATHSPVVLQEIPKSCVWKMNRTGSLSDYKRPKIETFGENVGVLTREIFGLEVVKSGFHELLVKSANSGKSYEDIVDEYNYQLGIEARGILRAIVTIRDGIEI
jgi:predicted ATPase